MIKIIGVGNPLLSDDGFGLRVVEVLDKHMIKREGIVLFSLPTPSPWDMFEALREGDFFILIDALADGIEGVVEVFPLEDIKLKDSRFRTVHEVGIKQVLEWLSIQGIGIKGVVVGTKGLSFELSLELTPRMQGLVDKAAEKVIQISDNVHPEINA